ncbi:hypothetical protein Cme02nite_32040 [Catellatospora methionotrophica]|uniref:Uncharacterized protein n=1 Tax=Catellatospora methionotrophica TaxID=121620 RepID=A0A8J3L9G5_9ACTN|nr:DUF6220 domain-containing protein [Catellatospora methionotrophica]GIG14872.1 hypothetical protein Cme02nite_32040 [Catellatospora methionotrophica]
MRKVFTAMAALLLLVVVAEFYFAASGAFGATTDDAAYRPHHVLGYVIFLLPLLMAAVAAAARLPRRLIWTSLLVTGMTTVQVVIAKVALALGAGTPGSLVFGLHAIGGLALLASVVMVGRQARRLADTPDPARRAEAAVPTAS